MATPFFLPQSAAAKFYENSPVKVRLNAFDSTGAAVSLASGYTINSIKAIASSGYNAIGNAIIDFLSAVTPTFDATGVTLDMTGAAVSTKILAMQVASYVAGVYVSNDGGTTESLLGQLTIQVDQTAQG